MAAGQAKATTSHHSTATTRALAETRPNPAFASVFCLNITFLKQTLDLKVASRAVGKSSCLSALALFSSLALCIFEVCATRSSASRGPGQHKGPLRERHSIIVHIQRNDKLASQRIVWRNPWTCRHLCAMYRQRIEKHACRYWLLCSMILCFMTATELFFAIYNMLQHETMRDDTVANLPILSCTIHCYAIRLNTIL